MTCVHQCIVDIPVKWIAVWFTADEKKWIKAESLITEKLVCEKYGVYTRALGRNKNYPGCAPKAVCCR